MDFVKKKVVKIIFYLKKAVHLYQQKHNNSKTISFTP